MLAEKPPALKMPARITCDFYVATQVIYIHGYSRILSSVPCYWFRNDGSIAKYIYIYIYIYMCVCVCVCGCNYNKLWLSKLLWSTQECLSIVGTLCMENDNIKYLIKQNYVSCNICYIIQIKSFSHTLGYRMKFRYKTNKYWYIRHLLQPTTHDSIIHCTIIASYCQLPPTKPARYVDGTML